MDKISLNLENCFGIEKLLHEFSFSDGKNIHIIYAQNGLMKTSLANTFQVISKGELPEDRIYHKPTLCDIKIDAINPINRDSIYVIHSYEADFSFSKVATLLVNEELRKKYEELINLIESEQEKLVGVIRSSLNRRSNEEAINEFCTSFGKGRDKFFDLLEELEPVINAEELNLYNAQIGFLLDPKVISIISNPEIKKDLDAYIETYKQLLVSTNFLRKGFNTGNAQEIAESLGKKGFFDAEHSVNLKKVIDADGELRINSKDDFLNAIRTEQEKILSDSKMKSGFEKLDKKLNNSEGNNFRNYLIDNIAYLEELKNPIEFKKKILISILQNKRGEYETGLLAYKKAKIELDSIITQANSERGDWENVIADFHDKFDVSFTMKIRNQKDVLLSKGEPRVYFEYAGGAELEQDRILRVLSQGEKRALYLLHIMFEVESRGKTGNEYLLIIDDIADSFDYRNKYAIIEYLIEISENTNFKLIILTHNFDFYRTTIQRNKCLWLNRRNNPSENTVWISHLTGIQIKITTANDIRVFENLKDGFHQDEKNFISSIPFVRNLIEYSEGENGDYKILTQALHGPGVLTSVPTNSECFRILNRILSGGRNLTLDSSIISYDSVHDTIIRISETITISGTTEEVGIREKIILSIGIRLKSEEFITTKIPYPSLGYGSNPTYGMIKAYQTVFPGDASNIKILKRVLLLISENIHLNSFMYEPLIDMNTAHLRKLYNEVKSLR